MDLFALGVDEADGPAAFVDGSRSTRETSVARPAACRQRWKTFFLSRRRTGRNKLDRGTLTVGEGTVWLTYSLG
jgi:hypothetical protein